MLKIATRYYFFMAVALGLAACDAYIEDPPLTQESSQTIQQRNMQQLSMQQRQVTSNSVKGGGGDLPPGAGPNLGRMQQMRTQVSTSTDGQSAAANPASGGVIGPRSTDQQQTAAKESPAATENQASTQKPVNKEHFSKGKQLYEQKNYAAAAQEFETFVKENDEADDVPEALYYAGNSYFELEIWDKAALAYRQIDMHYYPYPLAPQASLKLAQCYENLGQPKMAEAVRKNMKDKYPPGSY